ncbi:MLO-like protein 12 [Rhodamnia argentea]|uniref:MLO-like protein n=1 Tax=Rhodamnia argentea TaxID=178133 RepID=A0ABM3H7M8_9MYRT|nr:MLO-like protein 12 [Rhodamnia argentea]XP_048132579.1 MLO-like protein 12 [Rhodamnia argentea]
MSEESSTTSTATSGEERTLESTPTWAVATVCFVLILVSVFLEHLIQLLGQYLRSKRKRSLIQALDKIKSELMLLGFISLLLTMTERPIANICIPKSVAETFLPCSSWESSEEEEETKCLEQGKVSLLSREGVQQLQYLIFVLAFFHSLSCMLTFALGMAKMRKWESWEAETRTLEYQFSNDPRRFKLVHQTSFARRHLTYWSDHRLLRWPACCLRQFYNSVSKVDYLTLRHGFITAHLSEGSTFDFQKYIKRALEKDFGVVVGISFWMWIFLVIFIFFHAHGFYNYLWLPFIPLVMLLLVGTKLQGIITKMGIDSHDKSHVVRGTLLVRPSDHFFWFGRPKLLLHLIHFILFQNSFQVAFFTWTWYKFGFRSCFHESTKDIVIRFTMGALVQFICGYVTLPLYALVTQMGTSMRGAVFTENVRKGLKRWRATAQKKLALRDPYAARLSLDASVTSLDASVTSLDAYSPSFSLDASFSINLSPTDLESSIALKAVEDVKNNSGLKTVEERPRKGSFGGFVTNSTT